MYLTASIFVKRTHALYAHVDNYAFLAKNIKNSALYRYRQDFFAGKTPKVFDVISDFVRQKQVDYFAIPSKVSQQSIMQVAREFASYWGLYRKWKKDFAKGEAALEDKPSIPRYLKKDGRANIIFNKQAVSKKDFKRGILTLSAKNSAKLSFPLSKLAERINYDNLQEVKVVKVSDGYTIQIAYKVADKPVATELKRALSIDLGLKNLIAVGNNFKGKNYLVRGTALCAHNHYFNKQLAKLKSRQDKNKINKKVKNEQIDRFLQKKIDRLYRKRHHLIQDYLHKTSRWLINHAVENQIDHIIIGHNKGWKQEVNIGSQNNQNFVFIPHTRLIEQIKYKATLAGINVIEVEESYTSKCSFLDEESLERHEKYLGRRTKRGLFRTVERKFVNADINGAFNIMKKAIGKFNYDPIQVCSTPVVIKLR